jgi:hypothetical protein
MVQAVATLKQEHNGELLAAVVLAYMLKIPGFLPG